ncbi:MAG: hypothetical protein FWF22_01470 [Treponema sp.]|nr:hypothetical protein [Treponema sp.]
MDRRFKSGLAGLLKFIKPAELFLFLFAAAISAYAADSTSVLRLQTLSAPGNPVVGGTWTLTILADYPVTTEVNIAIPVFPSAMQLERVRTSLRLIKPQGAAGSSSSAEPEFWTAVEYLFTMESPGIFTLGPFNVSAGNKKGVTAAVTVRVTDPAQPSRRSPPVVRWEKTPPSLVQGQKTELTLALVNWDPAKPVPNSIFRGRAPQNFIMEELPHTGPGSDNIIRYPIMVIALDADNFSFGPFTIQTGGETLQIPALKIPVVKTTEQTVGSPAAGVTETTIQTENSTDSEIPGTVVPFPPAGELPSVLNGLFAKGYEKIMGEAQLLWNSGSYAGALALVRKNERDSAAGPAYAPVRREMEAALDLANTPDEDWRFWQLPLMILAIIIILIVLVRIIFRKNSANKSEGLFTGQKVTLRHLAGFKNIIVFAALGGAAIVFLSIGVAGFYTDSASRDAVLLETDAYRVPDVSGAVNSRLSEGQPVKIRSAAGSWTLIDTMDGRSGWVLTEAVIPY